MGTETTAGYDLLYDIIRRRSSIRKLKPDPIPDEFINKILEAGRWAMSGANSQPWEYIVVKDLQVKKDLFRCYTEVNADFIYWMEQQRVFELRHPAYQMTADKAVERQRRGAGWSEAPAVIVVLGDGRRQWGTVQGAHTFGRDQSHLTDGLANASFLIHLTITSLGLTSEWMSIHIQEPYKHILSIPDLLMIYLIIPISHPDVPAREGVRRPLNETVHRERYDMSKYISNEDVIRYLYSLREATVPVHSASRAVTVEEKK